tara:strand:+ start:132 stop:494 length:363 start_codon:yes stop_codon:yes gene_type:complete
MANKRFQLFNGVAITTNPTVTEKLSSNYSFSVQLIWAGLSGTANLILSVSMNDVNFDDFPVVDKDGNRLTTIPISGASGSLTIEVDSVISDYVKFAIDGTSATAGTITAEFVQIDNQDTY